ncbi:hypothetical protein N0V86_008401 [Didymella sp. IMI 355093]|nr:hypothetical protein N0V86_008401 [Didymella sp. IMI 355093]
MSEDASQGDHESLRPSTEERAGGAEGASAGFGHVPSTEPVVVHQLSTDSKFSAEAEVESVGVLSASTPVQCDVLPEPDARSHQKSFASNIFDDQDSLSAGIREYVKSKIAEAFYQHLCDCPVRAPLNITAKFELDNSADVSRSSSFKRIATNTNILHGPKRVGPFTFEHSPNTYTLQKSIVGIYVCIITLAAFIGPKTLLLTTWRLFVTLLTYFVIVRLLSWHKNAHPDLLLAPVFYAAGAIHNMFCDAVDQCGIFKIYLNSQIMRESLAEVRAVLDPK